METVCSSEISVNHNDVCVTFMMEMTPGKGS